MEFHCESTESDAGSGKTHSHKESREFSGGANRNMGIRKQILFPKCFAVNKVDAKMVQNVQELSDKETISRKRRCTGLMST